MSRQVLVTSSTHIDGLVMGVARLLLDTTHKLSDIQITSADGRVFFCHKLVLALKSPYFSEMLDQSPPPTSVASGIGADALAQVLRFIYMGEAQLNEGNVENVLRASHDLMINELTQFCVDYLLNLVATDAASAQIYPHYWRLAEDMNIPDLAGEYKTMCLERFRRAGSSFEPQDLSEKMLRELLEDDELVVESEEEVCEMVMRWLNYHKKAGYSVQPQQLLTRIRWSAVPVEYVKTRLLNNPVFTADRQCVEFLTKVVVYRFTGVQFSGLNTFCRCSTGLEQCAVIVGLDTGPTVTSDVYRINLQVPGDVSKLRPLPACMNPEVAACVTGNQLFVTGSGSGNNRTWKWESVFGWRRCADMVDGRRRHCATFVNSTTMLVLGGFRRGTETLSSIEQYNTITNKWHKVGQLRYPTQSAACATDSTLVYVFGGTGSNSADLDRVQVFDTATKFCTELAQRLPQPERLLRAVTWDRSVVLLNNRTCLVFDLDRQAFDDRPHFAPGIIQFGLVVENQRLFMVGGGTCESCRKRKWTWTCSDEVKYIEVMDVINNITTAQWTHHSRLPSRGMIHAFAATTLPIHRV